MFLFSAWMLNPEPLRPDSTVLVEVVMGRNGFPLPDFQYKTGQITARTDKCQASSAVPLPPVGVWTFLFLPVQDLPCGLHWAEFDVFT